MERLREYSEDESDGYLNARFLNLKETVGEGEDTRTAKVVDATGVASQLTQMVVNLRDALEKADIAMTSFNPNQFAALAVYFAKFLRAGAMRTRNFVNKRYCEGLRPYVPGDAIEAGAVRQEYLASQCAPCHYDGSGVPELAVREEAGQAIATAPVTCELCHLGFSGFDTFEQHCRRAHMSVAEYRKRAVLAGLPDLRPLPAWQKRGMAQCFHFFECTPFLGL